MGLTTAASGLTAAKKTLDVCSQNMANLQTNTYKRRFTIQADHAYHQLQGAGTPTSAEGTINPMGSYIGMGVQTIAVSPAMEQGQIEITDNPLDVAIDGLGFFEVELPNGETGFTRDGQFSLNNERMLVTAKGYKLKPEITIPVNTESYEITNEGQVYAKIQGTTAATLVSQITMAVFANPKGLAPIGNNSYVETTASGSATTGNPSSVGYGSLMQFAVEKSNVNPVVELTNLIEAQRMYSMNTKVMTATEEMDRNLESVMR